MKRLGKFVLTILTHIGSFGYGILSIIWYIASTLVCALAALLATPIALITKSNKCLLAILGVWVIALAIPAKLLGINRFDWADVSPKIANYMRKRGVDPVCYADENIERSERLIKDYWNDDEES